MRTNVWMGLAAAVVALGACNAVLGLDPVETRAGRTSTGSTTSGVGGAGGAAATSGVGGAGGAATTSTTVGSGGASTTGGCMAGAGGDGTIDPSEGAGGALTWTEVPINGTFEAWSGAMPDGWLEYNQTAVKAPCAHHGENAVRVLIDPMQYGSIRIASPITVAPGDYVFFQYSMRTGSGLLLNPAIVFTDVDSFQQIEGDNFTTLPSEWSTRSGMFQVPPMTTHLSLQVGSGDDQGDQIGSAVDIDDVHVFIGK